MISVEQLSYSFPQKDLYHDISFTLEDGRHCVLIGSNGTGKSTLLDLIVNTDDYILHRGRIIKDPGTTVGYIPQYFTHEAQASLTVFGFLSADFRKMQARIDALCDLMASENPPDDAFDRYQAALEAFEAAGGYNYESTLRRELGLAGLEHTADLPLDVISGGEYKLIQIIRAMLRSPDLLVMDEPDAFLDFDNIGGLSRLINQYPGTVLAVTHNRFLLGSCFDKVLHIEGEGLREFDGSYAEYTLFLLQMKAETQALARKDTEWIELQERLVEKLRDDATETIDPYRGKLLHARVSYLERLQRRRTQEPFLEEREVTIRLPALPDAAAQAGDADSVNGPIPEIPEEPGTGAPDPMAPVAAETLLRVENFCLAYDSQALLQNVSFTVAAGEKVCLVGRNGTGKTSLLRAVLRSEDPAITLAPGTSVGFLSQVYEETLHTGRSILDEMEDLGLPDRPAVASFLLPYGFDEEGLDQTIASLSGGEKNLLQLAKLSLGNASLLLLDEPSSHLDLPAQQALEQAVRSYRGAVLMVSHDFYTIVNCADTILFAENGTLRRMSSRAFRKMFYKQYFKADYLILEQQKTDLENRIKALLRRGDADGARALCRELEAVLQKMK